MRQLLLTVSQSPTVNECELHGTEKEKNLTFDLVVNRVVWFRLSSSARERTFRSSLVCCSKLN